MASLGPPMPGRVRRPQFAKRGISNRGDTPTSRSSCRRLPAALKTRHPHIPWPKVASIGNVLRHDYELMWALVRNDLPLLEKVCREELEAAQGHDR